MKIYNDDRNEAERRITDSDKARAEYYAVISNRKWGAKENYSLCLDCSVGNEKAADTIIKFVREIK